MNTATNWEDAWKDLLPEDIQRISNQMANQPLSIATGGVMKRFEKAYARFAGAQYAVSMNNGTAAIHSALWAVGVTAGDEVLICDYGFIAMAGAVTALRAVMVPVDMNPETLTMDPADLKRKITAKCRAVLVHNPWGVPAELDAIRAVTDLPIILDASHAHGAMYKAKQLANWADITCYSLGKGKLITGGELGCAVTDNVGYRDRMIILGHTHRSPFDLLESTWTGNTVGLKFRPHVIALEIALSQLGRFEQKKNTLLNTCSTIESIFSTFGFIPQRVFTDSERVYWRLVFHVDQKIWGKRSVEEIEALLKQGGLPVEDNHYWPLLQHQSPFLWKGQEQLIKRIDCPTALSVVPRLITLPAPVMLSAAQIEGIRQSLESITAQVTQTHSAP